jgi:AraC-like DNA-binding protein
MPASGSCIFTDSDSYQAWLQEMLDLVVPQPRDFRARLTWVELPSLNLLRAQEASPRVAYISLPLERVFVIFPTQRDSALICDGVEVRLGEIMFHSVAERFHQRTIGASRWGAISLTPASLKAFGSTITGQDLVPPPFGQVLRPPPGDRLRLFRLHAQAGRIAETNLNHLGHPEVARSLEQDLIWTLTTCLATGQPQCNPAAERLQAAIMVRFEAVLAAHPGRLLHIPELCSAIGISEQTLRTCCSRSLGMSAGRYQLLRRLKLAHAELRRADPATLSIAEVTKRYGFADLHRFVTEYQSTYGEMPSTPLRRAADR